MRTYEEIVELVTGFFNKFQIQYVVVGAFAVSAYGRPRTTEDLDLLLLLQEKDVAKIVAFLNAHDFDVTEQELLEAGRIQEHVTVFDKKSIFRIDVKPISKDSEKQTLQRKQKIQFGKSYVWINSPEDLILSKLEFGSPRDLDDAVTILLRQTKLDMDYVTAQSKKRGTYKKLQQLLEEVRQRKL